MGVNLVVKVGAKMGVILRPEGDEISCFTEPVARPTWWQSLRF